MSNSNTTITTETLTVRIPSEIVKLLDALVEKKLFNSRSEAIREFCREYVIENREVLNGR